jgi:uracil-DNA glycosylase family 4
LGNFIHTDYRHVTHAYILVVSMNTLKQMGIQLWQLKPGFGLPSNTDSVSTNSPELGDAKSDVQLLGQAEGVEAVDVNLPEGRAPQISEPTSAETSKQIARSSVEVSASGNDISSCGWQDLQGLFKRDDYCSSCSPSNSVLGNGSANANWMFVCDAPNSREIQAQQLLAGRAGELFGAMLAALSLDRESVYTTSVFKCAPTDDLKTVAQCNEMLHRQIELVQPMVVVTFGEFAAQAVIKANEPLAVLRESRQQCFRSNIVIVPTYSPKEMLDDASLKALVWQDLKTCLALTKT